MLPSGNNFATPRDFLPNFFTFVHWQAGGNEVFLSSCYKKTLIYSLIGKFLRQYAFYVTAKLARP
jgi:hypothetical protein